MGIICISCANNSPEQNLKAFEINDVEIHEATSESEAESFVYEKMIGQKLQDYYDLSVLQIKHPDFKETIEQQLRRISKDSSILDIPNEKLWIHNVRQHGKHQELSDSIHKIKIIFDIVGENFLKKDSITAIIKNKVIILDEKKTQTISISFSKN